MKQKGTHTWDISIKYHRCPNCGYIIEDRNKYEYVLGKYEKSLTCSRCSHHFIEIWPSTGKIEKVIK